MKLPLYQLVTVGIHCVAKSERSLHFSLFLKFHPGESSIGGENNSEDRPSFAAFFEDIYMEIDARILSEDHSLDYSVGEMHHISYKALVRFGFFLMVRCG